MFYNKALLLPSLHMSFIAPCGEFRCLHCKHQTYHCHACLKRQTVARKADAVARLAHAAAAPVTSQLPLSLQRWRLPHPLVHRHLQPSQPGSNAATRWRAKLHPTLPSSSSAFVFAAHAIMLDNGFTCAGTLSFEPNSAPLPSDWSQGAEAYVFHYQHPRSSPPDVVFVLKVLKLCPPSALPPSIRNLHCVTCCL